MNFMKKERIIQIFDEGVSAKFIFPNMQNGQITSNALTKVSNSIVEGGSPLIYAHVEPDRNSDKRLVNVGRVTEFDEVMIDVPSDIVTKIEEYDELKIKKDLSEEDEDRLAILKRDLVNYFDRI